MFILNKAPNKDFLVLNLADIQLSKDEWSESHSHSKIVIHTVTELVNRLHPDLITLSGDQGWAGDFDAYMKVGEFIDSFDIPWTFIWGNHDQQNGYGFNDSVVDGYSKLKNLIFENGPENLGRGNFVIEIKENDSIVSALILMDSHDRLPAVNDEGTEEPTWAKLTPEQHEWYKDQISALKQKGCNDTTILTHIPIYAYRTAFDKAIKPNVDQESLSFEESCKKEYWNEGYEDSFGVKLEGICCYPVDDNFFDVIRELGSTKNYICGHDHVNCTSISYEGVRLVYALKTGPGCYWRPWMNGGTTLRITSNGSAEIKHEFVNADHLL